MNRKFSLAYLTIPGTDPVTQIKIAKEAGYDSVSLRTIPMHLPGEPEFLPDKDPELFEAIKKALKEYDMPLMDIELARVRKDLDIEEYRSAFETAAKLGATDVLGSIWTRDRAWYTDTAGRIADMAKEAGLSQSHFMKFFKNTMGTSFIDYLNDYRLTMVSRLLVSSESSILDIAAESGFDNLSYFNRMFKKRFGMTPREYRKKFMEN